MSEEAIRSILVAELDRRLPVIQSVGQTFEAVIKRSLSTDDYKSYLEYAAHGAPGLRELAESGELDPIAQLLWEMISSKK
jgi:hypothetical protein